MAFLRALAKRESNMKAGNTKGAAWGLLEVVPGVLEDYNDRHGTTHTRAELLKPAFNVQVAAEALNQIIAGYRKHSEGVAGRNFRRDFSNPRFVELLVHGWNAGYSDAAGVGHVAEWMRDQGLDEKPITMADIGRHVDAAGAHHTLRGKLGARKRRWARGVGSLYRSELRRDRPRRARAPRALRPGRARGVARSRSAAVPVALLLGAGALAIAVGGRA